MSITLDDLVSQLTSHHSVRADPFRRVNAVKHSALVLVEFCQVLGPKPIKWFPEEDHGYNFDQIALWLMSAENEHGSTVTIFNQQMGVFALIHYSTLLDITARAFQRPFALSFISGSPISAETAKLFSTLKADVINPLILCNRQMFTHISEQMVLLANSIETDNFNKYYALTSTEPTPEMSKKLHDLTQQVRRMSPRFRDAYSVLSNHNEGNCSCGSSVEDFKMFFPLLGQVTATDLMPLFYLCPCVADNFDERFESMFKALKADTRDVGTLFVNNTPIMGALSGANTKTGIKPALPNSALRFTYTNTLLALVKVFPQLLFGILSGDPVIVVSSKERRSTMEDVLEKFAQIKPVKRPDEICIFESEADYITRRQNPQLVGIVMSRNSSTRWLAETDMTVAATRMDLNNQKLVCRTYAGQLLKPLNRLYFPTDKTLLAFVAHVLTNVGRLAVLVNSSSFEKVCTEFQLSADDRLILLKLLVELNVEKFSGLLKPKSETGIKLTSYNL